MVTRVSGQSPLQKQPADDHERWLNALFEHATDLILVLNADNTLQFVSSSVTRLLGYDMATYRSFGIFDLIHPDDLALVRSGYADCLAHPGPQASSRYRLRHADGSWRIFESTRHNRLRDPVIQGMVIAARDVTDTEEARRRLSEREAHVRSVVNASPIGIATVGLDGHWLTVNRALCEITGFPRRDLLTRAFRDLTHPDEVDIDLAYARDLFANRINSAPMEKRFVRKDGNIVWICLSIAVVRDEQRRPLHFIAQIQDISLRKSAEQALRESEARFRVLLENAADIVLLLDTHSRVRWVSPSINRVLGLDPGDLVGRSPVDLVHLDDRNTLRHAFRETVRAGGTLNRVTIRVRHTDGTYRWLALTGSNHLDNPAIAGVMITARDVSDRVEWQERRQHDALHDLLTGLPNRTMFEERLRFNLAAVRGHKSLTGVLLVDLDGFNMINDLFGQAAGDTVLIALGRRLTDSIRPTDLVARIGGDEFAVALLLVADRNEMIALVDRLTETLQMPFPVADTLVTIQTSIGWAISERGLDEPEALVAAAERVMSSVKRTER